MGTSEHLDDVRTQIIPLTTSVAVFGGDRPDLLRGRFRTARAQRGHSACTAPIITVIIQVTTLNTTPPAESCTINLKLKNSNI